MVKEYESSNGDQILQKLDPEDLGPTTPQINDKSTSESQLSDLGPIKSDRSTLGPATLFRKVLRLLTALAEIFDVCTDWIVVFLWYISPQWPLAIISTLHLLGAGFYCDRFVSGNWDHWEWNGLESMLYMVGMPQIWFNLISFDVEKHIMEINSKLYCVAFRDLPQLLLQGILFSLAGAPRDSARILSLIASSISILYGIVDVTQFQLKKTGASLIMNDPSFAQLPYLIVQCLYFFMDYVTRFGSICIVLYTLRESFLWIAPLLGVLGSQLFVIVVFIYRESPVTISRLFGPQWFSVIIIALISIPSVAGFAIIVYNRDMYRQHLWIESLLRYVYAMICIIISGSRLRNVLFWYVSVSIFILCICLSLFVHCKIQKKTLAEVGYIDNNQEDEEVPHRINTKPKKTGPRKASFGNVAALFSEQDDGTPSTAAKLKKQGKATKRDPAFSEDDDEDEVIEKVAPSKNTVGSLPQNIPQTGSRTKKRDPSFGVVSGLFADNDASIKITRRQWSENEVKGRTRRGLGFKVRSIDNLLVVYQINSGSPFNGWLKVGDVVLSVNEIKGMTAERVNEMDGFIKTAETVIEKVGNVFPGIEEYDIKDATFVVEPGLVPEEKEAENMSEPEQINANKKEPELTVATTEKAEASIDRRNVEDAIDYRNLTMQQLRLREQQLRQQAREQQAKQQMQQSNQKDRRNVEDAIDHRNLQQKKQMQELYMKQLQQPNRYSHVVIPRRSMPVNKQGRNQTRANENPHRQQNEIMPSQPPNQPPHQHQSLPPQSLPPQEQNQLQMQQIHQPQQNQIMMQHQQLMVHLQYINHSIMHYQNVVQQSEAASKQIRERVTEIDQQLQQSRQNAGPAASQQQQQQLILLQGQKDQAVFQIQQLEYHKAQSAQAVQTLQIQAQQFYQAIQKMQAAQQQLQHANAAGGDNSDDAENGDVSANNETQQAPVMVNAPIQQQQTIQIHNTQAYQLLMWQQQQLQQQYLMAQAHQQAALQAAQQQQQGGVQGKQMFANQQMGLLGMPAPRKQQQQQQTDQMNRQNAPPGGAPPMVQVQQQQQQNIRMQNLVPPQQCNPNRPQKNQSPSSSVDRRNVEDAMYYRNMMMVQQRQICPANYFRMITSKAEMMKQFAAVAAQKKPASLGTGKKAGTPLNAAAPIFVPGSFSSSPNSEPIDRRNVEDAIDHRNLMMQQLRQHAMQQMQQRHQIDRRNVEDAIDHRNWQMAVQQMVPSSFYSRADYFGMMMEKGRMASESPTAPRTNQQCSSQPPMPGNKQGRNQTRTNENPHRQQNEIMPSQPPN